MEKDTSIKVLYLSEWYPNRYDSASGRFVQGHAISAVKQGVDVCVLYLCKALKNDSAALFHQETEGVKEIYVYYHGSYLAALAKGWKYVRRYWGMPDLCQLNVITKNALLPIWLKKRYHIPYIIVEHWTGYYPESATYNGFIHKIIAQKAVKNAQMVLTVSMELAHNMQQCGLNHPDYRLIRNVVYDFFFTSQTTKKDDLKRFLHVSYFDDAHKNVSDIVRAIAMVAQNRRDFECVMVGNGEDREKVMQLARDLQIPQQLIRWTGELSPQQTCDLFYQSDFFVFYSNYETAGIVLTESLICGKPVITTPVGIAPDIISDEVGRIIPKRQPDKLARTIDWMLDHYMDFNTEKMRSIGQQYSLENVGKYLYDIYMEVRA